MFASTITSTNYSGPERRMHRVYVTQNSEYHLRGDVCIAVRDRKTGQWVQDHVAVGQKLEAGVYFPDEGGLSPHIGEPLVGDALLFHPGNCDLLTSRLERIERPPPDVVAQYPNS